MSSNSKKSLWPKVRKFFNDVHLWLGLSSGLVVVVVCLTGTLYVFNTELREMSSRHLYRVQPTATDMLPADTLVARTARELDARVTSVKVPHGNDRAWHVAVVKEGEASSPPAGGRRSVGTWYAVNPYTGEIIGNVSAYSNATTEFMRTMFSLHRWLLLDRVEKPIFGELPNRKLGSYITGTATIFFTLGVVTGLIIWFPRRIKNWRQGLVVKWNASWKRLNHDLHNTLAFYSLIFLFLMGVTGPQWSFPWYREGLQKTLGVWKEPGTRTEDSPRSIVPADSSMRAGLAVYLESADKALSYKGNYTITFASDERGVISVAKNRTGFFAPAAPDRLSLDQYSGDVLTRDVFRDKPVNQRIAGSIKAIHLGDVYGTFTKILYFLACLVATTLPITGTLIWINKLKKKKKKKSKRGAKTAEPALRRRVA